MKKAPVKRTGATNSSKLVARVYRVQAAKIKTLHTQTIDSNLTLYRNRQGVVVWAGEVA